MIELICLALAFIISVALGKPVIKIMKKLKFGQIERENAVESHLAKNGTPTVGGFIFLIPVLIILIVLSIVFQEKNIAALAIAVFLYGAVGFADDMLKIKKHSKDGLLWYQKMAALLVVSVAFAIFMLTSFGGSTFKFIFLGKTTTLHFGWLFIPFVVFVMLAMTNSVNLTDGLDGLVSGISIIVFVFMLVVSLFVSGNEAMASVMTTFTGALMGFLVFNHNPAKIFMGDTGSLALGGALGGCAIILRHPFMLVGAGLIFVLEALSVILQTSYFKLTHGKRIFKCSPLHHHFEKCGMPETSVTLMFWMFTVLTCVLTFILMIGF